MIISYIRYLLTCVEWLIGDNFANVNRWRGWQSAVLNCDFDGVAKCKLEVKIAYLQIKTVNL